MANSLQTEPVRDLLDRLFRAAGDDDLRRPEEQYIPVSPEGDRLLYTLIPCPPPRALGHAPAAPNPAPHRASGRWKTSAPSRTAQFRQKPHNREGRNAWMWQRTHSFR